MVPGPGPGVGGPGSSVCTSAFHVPMWDCSGKLCDRKADREEACCGSHQHYRADAAGGRGTVCLFAAVTSAVLVEELSAYGERAGIFSGCRPAGLGAAAAVPPGGLCGY